jgi:hypothetical protein
VLTRWVADGAVEEVRRVLEALEELGRADLAEHLPNAKLHPEPQYEDFEPQYPYYGRESASLYRIRIRA